MRRLLIAAALLGLFLVYAYWHVNRELRKTYDAMIKNRSTSIENSPPPKP